MNNEPLNQKEFQTKYRISDEAFAAADISWNDLMGIYKDYVSQQPMLLSIAEYVAGVLRGIPEVHTVRYRVKDPEHLIEKIIRKKRDKTDKPYTLATYETSIQDLVGVRAIHLLKEEWEAIHNVVVDTWNILEKPVANIRSGDSYQQVFEANGCEISTRDAYRSVHYIFTSQPSKKPVTVELQVRTIFEEGWSEMDHRMRYPYDMDNPLLKSISLLQNRLAGSADEAASFIQLLKAELAFHEATIQKQEAAFEEVEKRLGEALAKLQLTEPEKKILQTDLENLRPARSYSLGGLALASEAIRNLTSVSSMIRDLPSANDIMADILAQQRYVQNALGGLNLPRIAPGSIESKKPDP